MATQEENNAKVQLQSRLEAAKKKREQARQQREALESKGELERRVQAEEQAAIDEEAIYAAESEHGRKRVGTVETPLGKIVLKKPNPLHFKRFQDKESVKTKDLERLVRPCVVHPDMTRFDAILEEYPAKLAACANVIAELAGVRVRELAGK